MQILSTYFCQARGHLHKLCRTLPALTLGFLLLPQALLLIYCSNERIYVARYLHVISLAFNHFIAMMTDLY